MAAEHFDPSDDELKSLIYNRDHRGYNSLEREVYNNETEEQMARRIFRQALPDAAASIVSIAVNSTSDRTRLQAAQYIVERNLGKVGEDLAFTSDNALSKIVEDIETAMKEGR